MQNLRRLLGLPVLEIEHGVQIAEVQEVALNIEQASVIGLIVDGAGWFTTERGILFSDIYSIGRDAVMVRTPDVVQDFPAGHGQAGEQRLQTLCDKQIVTEAGAYLGVVTDVVFDQTTGEIKFYELSDGFITDFLSGRLVMPLPPAQVVGEDRLIVPEAAAKLLHAANHDPGGVV